MQRLNVCLEGRKDIDVVVVDNDPEASASQVLEYWSSHLKITSVWEPRPNISLARNAAFAAARGTWLACLDDDEQPDVDWLEQLQAAQRTYQADIVLGPVIPNYTKEVPDWLRDCRLFGSVRRSSGPMQGARHQGIGNALIRREAIGSWAGPFDPRFGLSGGEDTLFFKQAQALGLKLAWCDEAIVREFIGVERANPLWLLRRSYRGGQTFVRTEVLSSGAGTVWLRLLSIQTKAIFQLVFALFLVVILIPSGKIRTFGWLRVALTQVGKLSVLFGAHYLEYAGRSGQPLAGSSTP